MVLRSVVEHDVDGCEKVDPPRLNRTEGRNAYMEWNAQEVHDKNDHDGSEEGWDLDKLGTKDRSHASDKASSARSPETLNWTRCGRVCPE